MKKTDLPKDVAESLATLLLDVSVDCDMYEIRVLDKAVSFYGVRLFKTIGAAKSVITRNITQATSEYRETYAKTDELKNAFSIVRTYNLNYTSKALTELLLKSGVIVINKVA